MSPVLPVLDMLNSNKASCHPARCIATFQKLTDCEESAYEHASFKQTQYLHGIKFNPALFIQHPN